jgi:hypothetical protein
MTRSNLIVVQGTDREMVSRVLQRDQPLEEGLRNAEQIFIPNSRNRENYRFYQTYTLQSL